MKKKFIVRLCTATVTAAICLAGFFSFPGCGKKPEAKIENIMGYENAVINNKDRTISLEVGDSVKTLSFDIIGLPGDFKLSGVYSDENCRENVTGGNFVLYSGDNVFYLKIAGKGKKDKEKIRKIVITARNRFVLCRNKWYYI